MKLDTQLLTPKAIKKIQLFTFLKEHRGDLRTFSAVQNAPYATMYNYKQELTEELRQLAHSEQGKIEQLVQQVGLFAYRQYIYQQSVVYQLIMNLLIKKHETLAQFLAANKISKTTLYRRTKGLFAMLRRHGIQFSYQQFSLSGPEPLLQSFWVVFLNSTHTNLTPLLPPHICRLADKLEAEYATSPLLSHATTTEILRQRVIQVWSLRATHDHFFQHSKTPPVTINDLSVQTMIIKQQLGLSAEEAKQQAEFLDYGIVGVPQWPALLSDAGKARYQEKRQASPLVQHAIENALASQVRHNNTQHPRLFRQLCDIYQFIMIFGQIPVIADDLLDAIPDRVDSADAEVADQVLREHLAAGMSEKVAKMLAPFIYDYARLMNQSDFGINLYLTADVYTATTDIFDYWFHRIVSVQSIDHMPAVTTSQSAIVMYGQESPAINTLIDEGKAVGFMWLHELEVNQNLDRLLQLLIEKRFSLFGI